jgi:hypothetical protein
MNCLPVASTGLPVFALLSVGGIFVLAGVLSLILARSRRGKLAIVVVLLLLVSGGLTSALTSSPAAEAATQPCPPAPDPLTITQGATLTGLAPGVAPTAITGTVVNNSGHTVLVNRISVRITSVTQAPGAAAGECDATDYVMLHAVMPVGRALAPGASVRFTRASIGFRNKAVNQDACQGASVGLRYVSS